MNELEQENITLRRWLAAANEDREKAEAETAAYSQLIGAVYQTVYGCELDGEESEYELLSSACNQLASDMVALRQQLAVADKAKKAAEQRVNDVSAFAVSVIEYTFCERHLLSWQAMSFEEFYRHEKQRGCSDCLAEHAEAVMEAAREAAEWLETRPDGTEGDAAVSSRIRAALGPTMGEHCGE